MKISRYSYWIFIICFLIQFLFSRDWMMLEIVTTLLAIIPVIASLIVLYRRETTKNIIGKICISLMIS